MVHGQAEALLPMIEQAMREAGLPASALDCVAVTTGPGSFTGIRIGLAAARGIALGLGRPLLGVTSFEAVAAAGDPGDPAGLLLVALESRRADLYIQLFDGARLPLGEPAAVLPEALARSVAAAAGDEPLAIAGDAAALAAAALSGRPGTIVVAQRFPSAFGALRAALRGWRRGEREGSLRPLYLRPPDVGPTPDRPAPNRRTAEEPP